MTPDEPPRTDDAALPPSEAAVWDAAFAQAFARDEPEGDSVLERLVGSPAEQPRILLRDADEPASPPVLTSGSETRYGRYRILGEIARGGVGVILRGRDIDLGRDLAMKVLRDDHAGNHELIQRFVEEAQIGGQLQHPGIVPVYELGIDEQERPYFTMKLVQGDTLARLLETRAAPDAERTRFLRIFERVCDAIGYAHARGVVHRDLKPANVLVGSFGEVQVVDWGFAKVLSRGGVADEASAHRDERDLRLISTVRSGPGGMASQVGSVMGTPSYMPPEQARGAVDALDERTDVFALGAILCEVLTGQPPYVGENLARTAIKARDADLDEAFERLSTCNADAVLVDLCRACLSAEPAGRPADASVVARSVAAYLTSVEDRAQEAVTLAARAQERATHERRTRRLTVALAAAVLLIVCAVGGGYALHLERIGSVETRVHETLREASQQLAVGAVDSASTTVERAEALAEDTDVSADVRASIADVSRAIASAQEDVALIAALDAVRTSDDSEWSDVEDAYVDAFARAGFDLLAAEPQEIIARFQPGTELARAVALSLDDWVWRMRTRRADDDEQARRLLAIARDLDDDAWRNELRDAALGGDAARLAEMAGEADLAELPPQTVNVLAAALRGVGDISGALSVVESGVRAHPGDFFLQLHRGMVQLRLGRDATTARTSIEIARALRPDSLAPRMVLVQMALRENDVETARLELDDMVELGARDPRTRLSRAEVLTAEGRAEDALAVLDELLAERAELAPAILRERVRLLVELGNVPRAREALLSWLAVLEDREARPGRARGDLSPGSVALSGAAMRRGGRRGGRMGRGGRPGGGRSGGRGRPDFDANGDGRVVADELPEELRPYHDLLDRDGDGWLSGFELRVLRGLGVGDR